MYRMRHQVAAFMVGYAAFIRRQPTGHSFTAYEDRGRALRMARLCWADHLKPWAGIEYPSC